MDKEGENAGRSWWTKRISNLATHKNTLSAPSCSSLPLDVLNATVNRSLLGVFESHHPEPDFEYYFILNNVYLLSVTCFRLNLYNVYRRLKLVLVDELHLYLA